MNIHILYADGVKGFFDMTPPNRWMSSGGPCTVCELPFTPESPPSAPPFLLVTLFAVPGPCGTQALQACTSPQPQVVMGAEPSASYTEAQGEEAEEYAKFPQLVKGPPTEMSHTLTQWSSRPTAQRLT